MVRDRRARALVALEPPYLAPSRDAPTEQERFLGRWILEGSKPGAAAAAVWLSHRVIPLDVRGYGFLVARTSAAARRLHDALGGDALAPCRAVRFPAARSQPRQLDRDASVAVHGLAASTPSTKRSTMR